MASYQLGFDALARHGDLVWSKRLGTYTPPRPSRPEEKPTVELSIPRSMEPRRIPNTRQQQTGLPKPSSRAPSPAVTRTPEPKTNGTRYGLGKTDSKLPSTSMDTLMDLKGKQSRNLLRRKPSLIARNASSGPSAPTRSGSTRSGSTGSGSSFLANGFELSTEHYQTRDSSLKSVDSYYETVTRTATVSPSLEPKVIPELDRYRTWKAENKASDKIPHAEVPHKLSTQDLPPAVSQYSATPIYSGVSSNYNRLSGYSGSGYSASPSTRFSESPGPGAYSRDTTPTSMTSQSSGIIAPLQPHTPRSRQGSPATNRPPVSSRRMAGSTSNDPNELANHHGLPTLRESLNSSSSNSTVRDGDKSSDRKKKQRRLSPLPPSPPPRKSSQKFKQPDDQESPSKQSKKPVIGSPPEFVSHYHVSADKFQKTNTPPIRPSRDGTLDLQSQFEESMTVIQSNLAGINFSPDRRRSVLLVSGEKGSAISNLQKPPVSSQNASPKPVQTCQSEVAPGPTGLGIIPDLKVQPRVSSRGRTPSPSLGNPRFALFGRRERMTNDVPLMDTKEKQMKKGPTAGTGHEGYGKYATRGRSISAGGVGRPRDRSASSSSSQESFMSSRTFDPFLLERMSPVVIAGGGDIIENRNSSTELSRTESNMSQMPGRPSIGSRGSSSQTSSRSNEAPRNTLWPSALPKEASRRVSGVAPRARRTSDSSENGISKKPTLAVRRSMQRLNTSTGSLPLKLPKPLKLTGVISPSISSLDTSIMSDESLPEGRRRYASAPRKLAKRQKSPEKAKKWSFFHRPQKTPDLEPQIPSSMKVMVNKNSSTTPQYALPHYAILDSSDEQGDVDGIDLADILRDADVVELSHDELDAIQFSNYKANLQRMEEVKIERPPEFAHLAAVPVKALSPLSVMSRTLQTDCEASQQAASTVRPSRLPQVGRIPNVVRARPEQTSPKSFSRPFARLSTLQPLQDPVNVDKESLGKGPSPAKPSTPEPAVSYIQDARKIGSSESKASSSENSEFLAFSSRKNSSGTTGTTSSSGGYSYVGTVAVVPEADAELQEDEVWDEFNDLIERGDTPKVPQSATSSQGVPFQYEGYESRPTKRAILPPKESPTLTSTPIIKDTSPPRDSDTSSSVYSQEMDPRLKEAVNAVPTPSSSISFTEFFAGYGDRNNSIGGGSTNPPRPSSQSSSRMFARTRSHSRTSSDSRVISLIAQDDPSPIQQVNLRVGSMTVSKWLTFGNVLFSPGREEIMRLDSTKSHSILIIDGLGNDDWSFYAAETYPNVTFYNLSPTRPLSAAQRSSNNSFPLTPDNHRQVQYLSNLDKFPFPRDFFSTVVYRFPAACSEAQYRNIIAESKRVLKPTGYLEMSMLDLDMLNMGNRARRAVRGLKVKIQIADPTLSLAAASDTVLRLVGKKGFHDIKSCKVGVPVASFVTSTKGMPNKEELSLADMMKDESTEGDESITKMVAKVGRWWYTRTYENSVMPAGDFSRSIFNDELLLRECERWSTNFKLVVAYAQKPVVSRRRTASV